MKSFLLFLIIFIGFGIQIVFSNKKQVKTHINFPRKETSAHYSYQKNNICRLSEIVCYKWRVITLIMLQNMSPDIYLQQIQNFVTKVIHNCDSSSEMELMLPTFDIASCPVLYKIGSVNETDLVSTIVPMHAIVPDIVNSGNLLYQQLELIANCTKQRPLQELEGGVVFVFTNIDSIYFKTSDNLLNNQKELYTRIGQNSYQIRIHVINLVTDNLNRTEDESALLFSDCINLSSICELSVHGNTTNSLISDASEEMTCSKKHNQLSTAELTIIIAVPCVLVTIFFTTAAIIIYQKTTSSNRRFMRFWMKQSRSRVRTQSKASITYRKSTEINSYVGKSDNWEVSLSNLVINESVILGSGASSIVNIGYLKGKNLHATNQKDCEGRYQVAVKRLKNPDEESKKIEFFKEIEFMKNLNIHSNIIRLIGCVSNPWNPLIICELCENGDLLSFLAKYQTNQYSIPLSDLLLWSWQISEGMIFLSENNIIHRDLAARNVLLTKDFLSKIGDFGLCRTVNVSLYTARGGHLPIRWMALESLKYLDYTVESDVWSYAILLYEIFSYGSLPYLELETKQILEFLESGKRITKPLSCPDYMFSMMMTCWSEKASERPKFREISSTIMHHFSGNIKKYTTRLKALEQSRNLEKE